MKKIIWTVLISSVLLFYIWIGIQFYDATQSTVRVNNERQEYFNKLQRELSTPAAERAWKRLSRKHGWPGVVIYEPGKTPYYFNRKGQKCRFI
jgi:hypothetical protein